MKKLLFLLFLIIMGNSFINAESLSHSKKEYIITEVTLRTDKYTRESALRRKLNIKQGDSFSSKKDLTSFLDNKVHSLLNMRIFNDVSYSLEKLTTTGKNESYGVTFTVVSSWTLIPLIFPKYDSNTGFRIGGKIYYDNFFGSLIKFYLGANIDFQKKGEKIAVPQWSINPRFSNFDIWGLSFSLSLLQQYKEEQVFNGSIYLQNYGYYLTSLNLGTTFPLSNSFYYSISPGITFYYGYNDFLPDSGSHISKKISDVSFSQSIGFSSINWNGNFREGYSLSLSNNAAYSFDFSKTGSFSSGLTGSASTFFILGGVNPSLRFTGVYSFNQELTGLGTYLRGIRYADMYGIFGVFLNTGVTISVLKWKHVGEAQFQPFFDIGLTKKADRQFNPASDLKYSTGADFILYIDKLKSLVARGSIGIDLTNPDWGDSRKYEITIQSSLAY